MRSRPVVGLVWWSVRAPAHSVLIQYDTVKVSENAEIDKIMEA